MPWGGASQPHDACTVEMIVERLEANDYRARS